jgi:hypothetical protein
MPSYRVEDNTIGLKIGRDVGGRGIEKEGKGGRRGRERKREEKEEKKEKEEKEEEGAYLKTMPSYGVEDNTILLKIGRDVGGRGIVEDVVNGRAVVVGGIVGPVHQRVGSIDLHQPGGGKEESLIG